MKQPAFHPREPLTLARAVDRLTAAGYDHELHAQPGGCLSDAATGRVFAPEDLIVDETVRIEGVSDPGDESVVMALHDEEGTLHATYATAFGAEAGEADAEALQRLSRARQAG